LGIEIKRPSSALLRTGQSRSADYFKIATIQCFHLVYRWLDATEIMIMGSVQACNHVVDHILSRSVLQNIVALVLKGIDASYWKYKFSVQGRKAVVD
jgi:hypothetical protein